MTEDQETYLAVLKAAYDYDPQPEAEDEISVKESQVLLLLEKVDDDWWKVKVKHNEEGPAGLVPAAYVEPQEHISVVKAQYDYDAQQPGELTVKEEEVLYVYDKDDAWLLVHSQKPGGRVGFVPENYVEEIVEGEHSSVLATPEPSSLSQIIVPPSPPRPSAPYVDPEALVAATHNKAKADNIETWAVSEVDKKGKKKKGTLGVGNGAVFFASESDKTPVQKWKTSFLQSAHIDKSKHVLIEVGGPSPINLHFHAGSKDVAEAIVAKLKSSKELSSSSSAAIENDIPERPRSAAAKSVHFDAAPAIIPPREPSEDGEDEERHDDTPEETDADAAVVLYDFTADGEDELSVQEGESLTVLERDADDWWRVRNSQSLEGVVPASYIELLNPSAASRQDKEAEDARKAAAEEESASRAAAQRRADEAAEAAKKQEKEAAAQRAKAAAAAAEVDRRRRDAERTAKEEEREEQRERDRKRQVAVPSISDEERPSLLDRVSSTGRQSNGASSSNRNSRGPPPDNTRIWHDRSGQFRVEAKFLGFANGKLRLHKSNGVVIEVPSEKMSPEDMRYVERLTSKREAKSSPGRGSNSDDDESLASRRRSLREESKPSSKKGPKMDWFEFFLSAGCDVDDCTRYASSFDRDKIDESILPDITESTMRSLGLREGDIIRVKKVIDQRKPKDKLAQEKRDEEFARQLEDEESTSRSKRNTGSPAPNIIAGPTPPPNLFAGPNGVLKNNTQRRGRPQPSKSLPLSNVDITAISSASEQIQRTGSPMNTTALVQAPPRSSSISLSVPSGFDDDAWTNRPSSTKPTTPTPLAATSVRAPSAPPAPPAPVPPVSAPLAPTAPTQSAPTPLQSQLASKSLASTTEDDVFEQLARLSQLRVQSPAVSPAVTPHANSLPAVVSPPPRNLSSGMGMAPSPVPMGQLALQPPQMTNGPRGPFAPVLANQSLLQPLIPTTTGFNSFIPTRPINNVSPFQPPQQSNFLSSQPTGFPGPVMTNPTGFQPSFQLQSRQPQSSGLQPPGFQSSGFPGLQPQPTGFQPSGSTFGPSLPNHNFGQIQSNPTGFNAGYGHSPFGNNNAVPPVPPLPPPSSTNNTAPANIFAQMKAGTFATNNDSAPRSADQYDAFRPHPMTTQQTGWNPGPGTFGTF